MLVAMLRCMILPKVLGRPLDDSLRVVGMAVLHLLCGVAHGVGQLGGRYLSRDLVCQY